MANDLRFLMKGTLKPLDIRVVVRIVIQRNCFKNLVQVIINNARSYRSLIEFINGQAPVYLHW